MEEDLEEKKEVGEGRDVRHDERVADLTYWAEEVGG